jgi:tetratricopeptide (TPR) repeat protein
VKKRSIALIICITCLCSAAPLAAEDYPEPENPAWLSYEQGRLAMSRKDFGRAILNFREALAGNNVMPEAELALGDVFFMQGDYPVAERQYQRAYEQRAHFDVPDRQYEALYRLVRLYHLGKRYGLMEQTLRKIVNDDPLLSSQERDRKNFRNHLMALFRKKGFDAAFLLNRVNESFATTALSDLAEYYYRTWNFEPALEPAVLGVISLVTEGMLQIRRRLPDYRFTTLEDFLRTAQTQSVVMDYFTDRDFFRRLYYFGLICYELTGVRDQGRYLLRLLAATDPAGEYQRLARLQLKSPWRELRIDAPVIQMP